MPFNNPFKKKEKPGANSKGTSHSTRLPHNAGYPQQFAAHPPMRSSRQLTIVEKLQHVQDTLQKLRGLPATDLGAFPMLNECQRTVQQLREAMEGMPPADQDVWRFQLLELQESVQVQTDRIVTGTSSSIPAPVPNPVVRQPHASTFHPGTVGPGAPFTSGRPLQQRQQSSSRSHVTHPQLGLPKSASFRRQGYQPPAPPLETPPPNQIPQQMHPSQQQNSYTNMQAAVQSQTHSMHAAYGQPGLGQPAGSAVGVGYPSHTLQYTENVLQGRMQQHQQQSSMPTVYENQATSNQPPQPSSARRESAHLSQGYGSNAGALASAQAIVASLAPERRSFSREEGDMFSGLNIATGDASRRASQADMMAPRGMEQGSTTALPVSYSAATPDASARNANNMPGVSRDTTPRSTSTTVQPAVEVHTAPTQQQLSQQAGYPVQRPGIISQFSERSSGASALQSPSSWPLNSVGGGWKGQGMIPARSLAATSGTFSRVSSFNSRAGTPALDDEAANALESPRSSIAGSVATSSSTGMAFKKLGVGAWSSGMTAAAAAAHAAAASAASDGGTKKAIKKKTRGIKVGYGKDEPEPVIQTSPVIPGQPMPGPEYYRMQQQQQQQGIPAPPPQQQQQMSQQSPSQGYFISASPRATQEQQQQVHRPSSSPQPATSPQQLGYAAQHMHTRVPLTQQHLQQLAAQQQAAATSVSPRYSNHAASHSQVGTSGNATGDAISGVVAHKWVSPSTTGPVAMPGSALSTFASSHQGQQHRPGSAASTVRSATAPTGSVSGGLVRDADGSAGLQQSQHQMTSSAGPSNQASSAVSSTHAAATASEGQTNTSMTASAPSTSFQPAGDPIQSLKAYLSGLSGPLGMCQQAASQAAAQLVQHLAGLVQASQQQEKMLIGRKRSNAADVAKLAAINAQLEQQQQVAVDAEDFDTAAAIDAKLQAVAQRVETITNVNRQVDQQVAHLIAQRNDFITGQAEACEIVSKYLQGLHNSQNQVASMLAQQAAAEAKAAEQQHSAAAATIQQAHDALTSRRGHLAAAEEQLKARIKDVTAPVEAEKQSVLGELGALEAEIAALRELLQQKEAHLAASQQHLADIESRISSLTASFQAAAARLLAEKHNQDQQSASVEAQMQQLEASKAQTQERASTVQQQLQMLAKQGEELVAAAHHMASMADKIRRHMEADAASKSHMESLRAADVEAQERLRSLSKCIEDLHAESVRMTSHHAKLLADKAQAEEQVAAAMRALPELEAAKKAAAARKDFKEAAKLSAEAKVAATQIETLNQQLEQLMQAASQITVAAAGRSRELQELQGMMQGMQREVAQARLRFLGASIAFRKQQLEVLLSMENYEEAEPLQADIVSDTAEAQTLAANWGLELADYLQQQGQRLGTSLSMNQRESSAELLAPAPSVTVASPSSSAQLSPLGILMAADDTVQSSVVDRRESNDAPSVSVAGSAGGSTLERLYSTEGEDLGQEAAAGYEAPVLQQLVADGAEAKPAAAAANSLADVYELVNTSGTEADVAGTTDVLSIYEGMELASVPAAAGTGSSSSQQVAAAGATDPFPAADASSLASSANSSVGDASPIVPVGDEAYSKVTSAATVDGTGSNGSGNVSSSK